MKGLTLSTICKNIILTTLCVVLIFSYTYTSTAHPHPVSEDEPTPFPAGTMVGPVDVSGLPFYEGHDLFYDRLAEWRNHTNYQFIYSENSLSIPQADLISFEGEHDIIDTAWEEGGSYPITVIVNEQQLHSLLEQLLDASQIEELKMAELIDEISLHAANLNLDPTINLSSLIQSEDSNMTEEPYEEPSVQPNDNRVVDNSIASISIEYSGELVNELQKWVEKLNGETISANEVFSVQAFLEEGDITSSEIESLQIISSALYQAFLHTNFDILERYTSRQLPDNISLGFEAKILQDIDLKVFNPNASEYAILLSYQSNQLLIDIIGEELENRYHLVIENNQELSPRLVQQHNHSLSGGVNNILQEGEPGYIVSIFREVRNSSNEVIEKEWISNDYYAPLHQIEERNLFSTE